MKINKVSVSNSPEHHLSVEQMYHYLDNQLPGNDRHKVEQHLLDCDLCNDALAGFSLTSKDNTDHQLFQINYYLKNRIQRRKPNTILQNLKNWGITTIILFILLLAALLVWYQVKEAASSIKFKPPTTLPALPVSNNYKPVNLPFPF